MAVVGAGVAGAALAWRVQTADPRTRVDVFTGGRVGPGDATGTSGGLVRGFETVADACRLAAESLVELRGSPTLRDWSAFRESGSVYLLPAGAEPGPAVATVDRLLPGSVAVKAGRELSGGHPFRGLPTGTVGIVERFAGHLSPARLRAGVLTALAEAGGTVREEPVTAVASGPRVRLADGSAADYDVVVVATGAWTADLLSRSGMPAGDYRARQIQYSVFAGAPPGLRPFVDEGTGLYGRPLDGGGALLGLPSTRWLFHPRELRPEPALAADVAVAAGRRFDGLLGPPLPERTVTACDCYHDPPGLALRPLADPALFSFTGGSGGAAKTVLAASREAAAALAASGRTRAAAPDH